MLANGEQMVGGYGGLSFAQTGILYAIPNLTDTRASAPSPEDIYDRYDTMRDLRSDMDKLRQGDTVSDKLSRLTFKVWVKNEQGQLEARDVIIWLTARDAQHGVFFGDRPLDNPGYSAMTLQGEVNVGSTNKLDIFKVEQRLKYLGYPALKTAPTDNTIKNFEVDGKFTDKEQAALKLFEKVVRYTTEAQTAKVTLSKTIKSKSGNATTVATVTVELEAKGALALEVVKQTVTTKPWKITFKSGLTPEQKQLEEAELNAKQADTELAVLNEATEAARKAAWAKIQPSTRFDVKSTGADGIIEATKGDINRELTLNWLNAYNAPHWMRLFSTSTSNSLLPGWYNSQNDNSKGDPKKAPGIYSNVERYGTSWMFDLMRAREFAPQDLRPSRTIFGTSTTSRDARFNGATDGNHQYTPRGHASHDLGLALDLGVKDLISDANQKRTDQNKSTIATVANPGWSLVNAIEWAGSSDISNAKEKPTPKSIASENFQQDALRDFLSLYQATREDLTARILAGGGNAADRLKVQNALFRSDGQSTIPLVLFGDGSKNSYANVRSVLTNLGIKNATSSGHHNHFHIYLKPPSLQAIVKSGDQNLLTNFESNEQINAATEDQTMMLDVNFPVPDDVLNPPALIAKSNVQFRDWGGSRPAMKKASRRSLRLVRALMVMRILILFEMF